MAVPSRIAGAYAAYLEAAAEVRKNRRVTDGLLGFGNSSRDRCQDDFAAALSAAVDEFAASAPDVVDVADALRYMFAQAHEHRDNTEVYWMLMASHVFAMPLIKLLPAALARELREGFEAEYPRRERMPAQKNVIDALKAREKA